MSDLVHARRCPTEILKNVAESASLRRKRYRRAHPEVRRVIEQLRRARLAGAGGKYRSREWADLILLYQSTCAYDGAPGPLQPDHRIPLARGGTNQIENILPACGRCNRRKHLMSEAEFRARLARERQIDEGPAPEL